MTLNSPRLQPIVLVALSALATVPLVLPVPAPLAARQGPTGADEEPDVLRLAIGDPERRGRTVEVVVDGVVDTDSGEVLTPAAAAARLSGARLVLFGESHTSMDVHRAQLQLLEEIHATSRPLLIGLEMFPYTAQEGLDRWVAGLLTEKGFLDLGGWYEHWGIHWGYYREIFRFARDRGVPLVAVNAPREVVSEVRRKGLEELSPEERSHVPPSIDLESEDHRTLFRTFFMEEDGTIHSGMTEEQLEAMRSAQVTWDAAMAYNAVRALEGREDDAVMVVLLGSGHVAYGLGAERQARQWLDGGIASVVPVAIQDEDGERVEAVQASYADFVWGLPPADEPLYPALGVSTVAAGGDGDDGALGQGRRVIFVPEDSVGARAGLEAGDVIVAVDGRSTLGKESYNRALAGYRWGDRALLTVLRDGEERELEVLFRRSSEEADDEEE